MGFMSIPTEQEKNDLESPIDMAMVPERSRSLHNFSLPCLKWGGQKHLCCVRLQNQHPQPQAHRKRSRSVLEISSDGIEAAKKKLKLDLQTDMDNMKFAVPTLWNLRKRRALRKDPNNPDSSFKSPSRPKFSLPLSKHEIQQDFIAMTGVRPPRKPKKRPRNVNNQLQTLFPGSCLSEITPDMYKVDEKPEPPKRK